LNAEFTKFDQGVLDPNQPNGPDGIVGNGDEFQVLTGNQMQGSPRHKVALNTLYRTNLMRGTLALSGTYTWTDDVYYSIFNTPTYLGEAHGEADFRATWSAPSGNYDLIGYIANAFDERYGTNIGLTSTSTGRVWQPGDPRTYGAQVIYRF
jgi:outer membrane receptor for ferric coprogen and ferric-rhodotorulic acid